MNLPNVLTFIRILLIPIFVILIINRYLGWAAITFAVAGITDGIDGLVARLTHQRTELGAYLDPIADKLLLSSAFITLAIIDILPNWLAVIVITRDVIILVGFLLMAFTNHRPNIRPSLLSKITTVFQISTILIFFITAYYPHLGWLSSFAIYGTTLFTILSGSHYVYLGTKILNEKKVNME
jgi:cardiolipin synthase (CMP-forming)